MTGACDTQEEVRNTYKILVVTPGRSLRRYYSGEKYSIKIDLRVREGHGVT
jgi:hypothetical protein